ncbi:MAG TPA: M14 family metallopeptidase [Gemmatimonadaceae bacterium]|nr:M14 family metallopeptidase [Gemmatimonadaceae bacterium]
MARSIALVAGAAIIAACASSGPRAPNTGTRPVSSYPPRNLADLRPQTRAERTGFSETSRHADVMVFIDSLKAMSNHVHVATLGRSTGGREIPMVVASRPLVRSAVDAKRLNRPIVYVQGNIHGGEVEGKEASLSLLRDLVFDRYANVLDSIVLVVVPIYNADGNDSLGPQLRNRGAQNGPEMIGLRPNGQGLDLNRDYIKAEAPETRASLDFFREWDPDVFVDLHTTNGSYHGYALTWAPPLNPAALFTGPFTRDTVLPALRDILRTRLRIQTFPYGNFASQDSVQRGWFSYDHRPRFGTNYYGLRGRIGILSEAYSHDPFAKRVASTYSFVYELLSIIANNRDDFLESGRVADLRTTGFAAVTPANSPRIAIRSRLTQTPRMDDVLVEDLVRTGDSVRTEPGLRPGIRRTGNIRTVRIPIYDRFDPVLEQTLPFAWVVPTAQAALLEPLRRNGVFIEQLAQSASARVEWFVIDSIARGRAFQGHQETSLSGRWEAPGEITLDSGTYIIRAGQPLGILALYLLEPQSDDGLVTWNFVDPWLQPGNRYPIMRVVDRTDLPLRPAR